MRRVFALLLLAMIVAGGFEAFYIRIFFIDAAAMRQTLTELPFRRTPGLRRFLVDVDARTPPGARVALWVPYRKWYAGYGYAYCRANFLIPSKQIVPLLTMWHDDPALEHLRSSDYVAAWRGEPAFDGFVVVWRSADGTLLRRVR